MFPASHFPPAYFPPAYWPAWAAPTPAAPLRAALVALWAADAGLAALVGDRVYPGVLPQGGTLPAIVYQVVSNKRGHHLRGADGVASARVQVDCYAATPGACEDVADALALATDGFRGAVLGRELLWVAQDGERDLTDDDADGDDAPCFRISSDYRVRHRVAVPPRD